MNLHSTILFNDHYTVCYNVSWQQDKQFLLFKPELPLTENNDYPTFWACKQNGAWNPINVQDLSLVKQWRKTYCATLQKKPETRTHSNPFGQFIVTTFMGITQKKKARQKWQAVIASRKLQRIEGNKAKEINSGKSTQPCFHGLDFPCSAMHRH